VTAVSHAFFIIQKKNKRKEKRKSIQNQKNKRKKKEKLLVFQHPITRYGSYWE